MTTDDLMSLIVSHLTVINDPSTLPPTRATHGEWLAERVGQLDALLINGAPLPSRWRPPRALASPVEEVQRELDAHPTWNPDLRVCPTCAADPGYRRAVEAFGGALVGHCAHVEPA